MSFYPSERGTVSPTKITPLAFDKHVVMIRGIAARTSRPVFSDHHPAIHGESSRPVSPPPGRLGLKGRQYLPFVLPPSGAEFNRLTA